MDTTTFFVNILYRRNGTWQGQVTWAEGQKTVSFRSALELVKLMESVGEVAVGQNDGIEFRDVERKFEGHPL